MYADRLEGGTWRTVKEHLDGNFLTDSTCQHKITRKRFLYYYVTACELFSLKKKYELWIVGVLNIGGFGGVLSFILDFSDGVW